MSTVHIEVPCRTAILTLFIAIRKDAPPTLSLPFPNLRRVPAQDPLFVAIRKERDVLPDQTQLVDERNRAGGADHSRAEQKPPWAELVVNHPPEWMDIF